MTTMNEMSYKNAQKVYVIAIIPTTLCLMIKTCLLNNGCLIFNRIISYALKLAMFVTNYKLLGHLGNQLQMFGHFCYLPNI